MVGLIALTCMVVDNWSEYEVTHTFDVVGVDIDTHTTNTIILLRTHTHTHNVTILMMSFSFTRCAKLLIAAKRSTSCNKKTYD